MRNTDTKLVNTLKKYQGNEYTTTFEDEINYRTQKLEFED